MNSRPMAAPIWAASLAVPRRSSRAISEARERRGDRAHRSFGRAGWGSLALRFQQRFLLGHLLDEERYAVGSFDDFAPDPVRQAIFVLDVVDQDACLAFSQAGQVQRSYVRFASPGRFEFRPETL